jgi:hypothetical protein
MIDEAPPGDGKQKDAKSGRVDSLVMRKAIHKSVLNQVLDVVADLSSEKAQDGREVAQNELIASMPITIPPSHQQCAIVSHRPKLPAAKLRATSSGARSRS